MSSVTQKNWSFKGTEALRLELLSSEPTLPDSWLPPFLPLYSECVQISCALKSIMLVSSGWSSAGEWSLCFWKYTLEWRSLFCVGCFLYVREWSLAVLEWLVILFLFAMEGLGCKKRMIRNAENETLTSSLLMVRSINSLMFMAHCVATLVYLSQSLRTWKQGVVRLSPCASCSPV